MTCRVPVVVRDRLLVVPVTVKVNVPRGVGAVLIVRTDGVPGVAEVGENEPDDPTGKPPTDSDTAPLNPLLAVTITVYAAEFPPRTDRVVGLSVREKSGAGGALTTRLTVDEWMIVPLVPLIASVDVPVDVKAVVATVSVEVPLPPITGSADHDALAPVGRPFATKVTGAVKPPLGVTVTV